MPFFAMTVSRKTGFYSGRDARMQVGCAPVMSEPRTDDLLGRRMALYAYLEPLLSGRRVLEVQGGHGGPSRATGPAGGGPAADSAQYLRSLGARVVSIDGDVSRVDDRFDVVLVPEGEEIARRTGAVATLRRVLVDGGRLILA